MIADWIAVDWGTSNLRIWAMSNSGAVLDERTSDEGMVRLAPVEFEPALLAHISPWLGEKITPVVACGMLGSRQGWHEAPYDRVPIRPGATVTKVRPNDPRIELLIISGLRQSDPADLMRGEETQIAGFLLNAPSFEGALCMPGTHSKWAVIKNGEVSFFKTALTGELFELIAKQSVIRHSLGTWDDNCFLENVRAFYTNPDALMTGLFSIRAKNILDSDGCGIARLSGALIGVELAGTRDFWHDASVTIIGEGKLSKLYGLALSKLGVSVDICLGDSLTIAGLTKTYEENYL